MMKMIPYESAAISISVKKGNPLGISRKEDLAGRAVGVEIGGLDEKKLMLYELGFDNTSLNKVINSGYNLLNMITFYVVCVCASYYSLNNNNIYRNI